MALSAPFTISLTAASLSQRALRSLRRWQGFAARQLPEAEGLGISGFRTRRCFSRTRVNRPVASSQIERGGPPLYLFGAI